jgi:hypothetical protein
MTVHAREFVATTIAVPRENLHWRRPLIAAVVSGALAAACIALGHPTYALPFAVGAWCTALTDGAEEFGIHWRTMAWTCLWVAAGATLGGFVSTWGFWELPVVAVVSLVCGYVACLGRLGIGCGSLALALYAIFAGEPITDRSALQTGTFVLLGGVIAIAVTYVLCLIGARQALMAKPTPVPSALSRLRSHLTAHDEYLWHGVRLSIAMVIGTAVSHSLGWPHEYWIPMTIALIARPSKRLSLERTVHRVLGTLAGIVVLTALVLLIGSNPYELAVLVAIGAGISLAVVRANYTLACVGYTIGVMCLFAIEGQSIELNTPYRIMATVIAGIITALCALLWLPDRARS